ncbi:MAG: hypothetical protein Q9186_000609 [Xanthomendoza sp. 1 TL-2023]
MAYDTPSATTEAEIIALNALDTIRRTSFLIFIDEQLKIHPKMTTHPVVRYSEFNGSSSCGCTFAKTLEKGRPPSRAKAHVIRLLVVMMLVVAKRRQMRGKLFRQSVRIGSDLWRGGMDRRSMMDAVRLFVALKKMWSKGPASDSMTSSTGPATKRRTMRKMKPVKVPIPTQAIMIRGPSTVGFGISVS